MKRTTLLFPVTVSLLAAACGAAVEDTAEQSSQASNLETATQVAALEVNEDGSDIDGADATENEPLLLRRCGFGPVRRHLMRRFDANEDGGVNGEERDRLFDDFGGPPDGERPEGERPEGERPELRDRPHAHLGRHHRLRMLHELYDEDSSGELDEDERATLEADLTARCEMRIERLLGAFDADGNGELDVEEWEAAHAAIRERFAEQRAERIADFDIDGDGELDPEERRAAHESRIEQLRAHRARLEAAFDADGNGELDEEERDALREALKARIRGEATNEE